MAWSNREDLGGVVIGAPAAASWATNRLDVFARGTNNNLFHKAWDGSEWSDRVNLRGIIDAGPGVGSWGANRIDVFAPGTNNHLFRRWWA